VPTTSTVLTSGFDEYTLSKVLGEGGAGRVYAATSADGTEVAIKVLLHGTTAEKKKRFKNELRFLERNDHPNIVSVIDRGNAAAAKLVGPFYVMERYTGSLRSLLEKGIEPAQVMHLFAQILDGVEAAHLKAAVHRDLKPENILFRGSPPQLAVADFGCASFAVDEQATAVETREGQRLANFRYSAPEQRTPGMKADRPADIFALGLILNEMFTGNVAQGVGYPSIAAVSPEHAYLDEVVQKCLSHAPGSRPNTVAEMKALIQRLGGIYLSEQKLSALSGRVIDVAEIDQPLADHPPRLVDFHYDLRTSNLVLILDRPVDQGWVTALRNMGNYTSAMGHGPETFHFAQNTATTSTSEHEIQQIIDYFKGWLPVATGVYKSMLAAQAQRDADAKRAALAREFELEQRKAALLAKIKI